MLFMVCVDGCEVTFANAGLVPTDETIRAAGELALEDALAAKRQQPYALVTIVLVGTTEERLRHRAA
jgi:hypothetical protein